MARTLSALAFLACALFCLLHCSEAKKSGSKKEKTTFPLWDNTLPSNPSNRTVNSYLFPNEGISDNQGIEFIRDIMEVIHAKQHPPVEECKNKRFTILQMSSTSFEGTGSILKQVMIGLSIAMHSNRTLIWGIGHPFMFEHTKDLWQGPNYDHLKINNDFVDCTQEDPAGGPFGCFLQPISTCSLADVSPTELIEFSHNAYNESSRLVMGEIRKGVALYHPPFGLFDYIWSERKNAHDGKYEIKGREAHLWAAAVTAYVFRLKPDIVNIYKQRADQLFAGKGTKWGMHVRHGDLKALSNVYSYKEIFEFEEFFTAARALTHVQKKSPDVIFVATDSVRADSIPDEFRDFNKPKKSAAARAAAKAEKAAAAAKKGGKPKGIKVSKPRKSDDDEDDEDYDDDDDNESEDDDDEEGYDDEEEDEDEDEEEDEDEDEDEDEYGVDDDEERSDHGLPQVDSWFSDSIPSIVTINNTDRYRTEHGSHTVAANGGCLRDPKYSEKGMRCALNYEDILLYQGLDEHRSVPRSVRLMRVLFESIEDLYTLSICDSLLGSGSSHFSTLAGILVWARTGTVDWQTNVHFLDALDIEKGKIPTALLHGMNLLNGTHGSKDKDAGEKRWTLHTTSFITGIKRVFQETADLQYDFNPWAPENIMRMVNGLPHLPEKVFYTEAKSWIATGKYKPHFPGNCPGKYKKHEDIGVYAATVINLGVEHLDMSHPGQALLCWADAAEAIQANIGKKGDQTMLKDALSVAKENAATMRLMRYAEMVINENRDTKDFYKYHNKYMEREYDGVYDGYKGAQGKRRGGGDPDFDDGRPTGEGKEGLMTLEELNEKVIVLEEKLKKYKELRDKMLAFSQSYANELRAKGEF